MALWMSDTSPFASMRHMPSVTTASRPAKAWGAVFEDCPPPGCRGLQHAMTAFSAFVCRGDRGLRFSDIGCGRRASAKAR